MREARKGKESEVRLDEGEAEEMDKTEEESRGQEKAASRSLMTTGDGTDLARTLDLGYETMYLWDIWLERGLLTETYGFEMEGFRRSATKALGTDSQ